MALESLIAPIVSVGGLAVGMMGTWVTVRSYYDKRREEDRKRQLEELDRLQAARQKELEEYAASKQKAYAAERDFAHLRRQYDTLATNIKAVADFQTAEMRPLEGDMREVKALLNLLLLQIGQTDTAILRHLKRKE